MEMEQEEKLKQEEEYTSSHIKRTASTAI